MATISSGIDISVTQGRSAAYTLVAHGFRYPDDELTSILAEPARWLSWPEALCAIDAGLAGPLEAVRASLRAYRAGESAVATNPPDANTPALQDTFNDLFGHAVHGKCPPYELEYGRSEIIQRASSLADVSGFYAAFGAQVADATYDRPDHITVECEFMSLLCSKEAHAAEAGDTEHLKMCIDAQRGFLKDHLSCWLPGFAYRVSQADPSGFYGVLSGFAAQFIASECRRFEIAIGPQTIELTAADPALDTMMDCPTADDPHDSQAAARARNQFVQIQTDPAPAKGHRSV